jgi:pyridoxal phosphate enzyme (YggS family)
MQMADTMAERAERIRAQIAEAARRSGRTPEAITIVAVSKTMPAEMIRAAYALGFTIFGENRVQEAQSKIREIQDISAMPDMRWELIGHLQTNKAARAAELFARVQSVDSLRLAETLDRAAAAQGKRLPVLIEVNVAGEASKSGFAPNDLRAAATAIVQLPHLLPQGLMTVAPLVENAEAVRPVFVRMRELRDELRRHAPIPGETTGGWNELSMGMSDDFTVAIAEGATIVRIGRALFGERPQAAKG